MINSSSDAWNLGAKTGMVYFVLCFIWAIWIWFFLPETKNRSFADLDYLFQKKVNARKFPTFPIDCKSSPPAPSKSLSFVSFGRDVIEVTDFGKT